MQLVAIMAKQTQRNKYTIIFSPKNKQHTNSIRVFDRINLSLAEFY